MMGTAYANQVYTEIVNSNNKGILNQSKSKITTNSFIPKEQKEQELSEINIEANKIIEDSYNQRKTRSITNMSFEEVSKNISLSVTGIIDDSFNSNMSFIEIIEKEQRYAFIGVLIIILCILYLFVTNF